MLAERNKRRLQSLNITDILQVAEGLYPNHPLNFNYMNIQVQDSSTEDLVVHFSKCFAFIDAAIARKGNVIVHCAGGVSRSATVVIGYLMARHDDALSFDQALSRVREVRPFVRPNPGFEAQLREWERLGRDMGKWAAWRRVWQERERSSASSSSGRLPVEGEQVAGGEGGGRGYGQCVIAIPPPVDARCCGGSAPAGQLPAELLVLAQLNVDGEAVMN